MDVILPPVEESPRVRRRAPPPGRQIILPHRTVSRRGEAPGSAPETRDVASRTGEGTVMQKRTTSADVARAAGVSRATVSYVLNDTARQSIPERTRARVRAAAAELNYTPNPAARALRSGRSTVTAV